MEGDKMKQKRLTYYGLPLLGTILCLWYIKEATYDVVYSDYIRIVNTYLPDVWKPEKFFRPDVLTRIPVYYLVRIINVYFFHYSTTFEMAFGVLGLGLSGLALARYCAGKQVGLVWYGFLMFLLFGLDKWEMMANGTGCVHFLAFACFYYHYVVFDRVLYGDEKRFDRILLLVLPPVTILAIAGPYCAVYSVVMALSYGFAWVKSCKESRGGIKPKMDWQFCLAGLAMVAVPFLLYMWSNSYALEDHDGAVAIGLFEALAKQPLFFPGFLLKSLASMVVGGETISHWMEGGVLTDGGVYLMGALVAGAYGLALYLNWRFCLYQKTLLPIMLVFAGMGNHGIVLISRYIFLREGYGMSSRYALQYQAGILGIVLTFALVWKGMKEGAGRIRGLAMACCVVLLAGHGYTDYEEIKKAPYREAYGERIAQVALCYEDLDDDALREAFDYRKGREESGKAVRRALQTLKDNGLNVFGR